MLCIYLTNLHISMALKGINVIELAGLAPAPFCGMLLSDFGATVLRIDKIAGNTTMDCVANGKQSVALNLKNKEAVKIFRKLCLNADVLVEPFRKGVMESFGLGPEVLLEDNPRLIYARLTGYGQSGPYSNRAGHDINYLGLSGLLSLFGRQGEKPTFPTNFAADFAGGGLMCALGIILALFERSSSGKGQVVDCSMVEGSAYVGSWLYRSQSLPLWNNPRGKNFLDTGAHFYETYETKDGKFMAVGAIEPQFYSQLIEGLALSNEDSASQFSNFEETKKLFASKFLEKTQDEWCKIFDDRDACVTPILSVDEAPKHLHNVHQKSFTKNFDGRLVPNPAPKLSRTPGQSQCANPPPQTGQHTEQVLKQLGYSNDKILELETIGAIKLYKTSNL